MPDPTPTLHTPRLRLEPVELRHAPDLQRHFADWEIIKNLVDTVPWPYPDDGVVQFFAESLFPRIAEGRAMAWALVPKDTTEAIGLIEWRPGKDDETGNRGFWIARPWQNQGLMTEAVTALHDYVFLERGAERLVALNAVGNLASRRIKEKSGAVFDGIVELEHHSGETRTERWVLTREAWLARRA